LLQGQMRDSGLKSRIQRQFIFSWTVWRENHERHSGSGKGSLSRKEVEAGGRVHRSPTPSREIEKAGRRFCEISKRLSSYSPFCQAQAKGPCVSAC